MKKKILLSLLILSSLCAHADEEFWAMKTQTGQLVKISDVSYILQTDGAKTFSVVTTEATINDVTSITFVKTTATGITTVPAGSTSDNIVSNLIGNELIIIGAQAGAAIGIYDTGGAVMRTARAGSQETHIDVNGLKSGIYILKVGDSSVKFYKK